MDHLNDILDLSTAEKLVLIEKIWESMDPSDASIEITKAQKQELDRRLKKLAAGKMEFSSWEETRARVRSQIS